jgi:putative addiction module component (TIGR02574 family)
MLKTAQVEKMSVAERLQIMEQLWDTLRPDAEGIASPGWHEEVLIKRKVRAQRGEAKFLTLDQLKARLAQS